MLIVRKLRLQRGWSQETLAELTGLSTRTIQRIEKGDKPSLESAKSLASVFDVHLSTFSSEEAPMADAPTPAPPEKLLADEADAIEYVKGIKEFYSHLIVYLAFVAVYGSLSLFAGMGDTFIIFLGALGWGVGIVMHGLTAYEIVNIKSFTARWERRQIEKRLKRKL